MRFISLDQNIIIYEVRACLCVCRTKKKINRNYSKRKKKIIILITQRYGVNFAIKMRSIRR